jgi:hypothetical protein
MICLGKVGYKVFLIEPMKHRNHKKLSLPILKSNFESVYFRPCKRGFATYNYKSSSCILEVAQSHIYVLLIKLH